jgi:hypothetical protein
MRAERLPTAQRLTHSGRMKADQTRTPVNECVDYSKASLLFGLPK